LHIHSLDVKQWKSKNYTLKYAFQIGEYSWQKAEGRTFFKVLFIEKNVLNQMAASKLYDRIKPNAPKVYNWRYGNSVTSNENYIGMHFYSNCIFVKWVTNIFYW
jgi:hypothetical protein